MRGSFGKRILCAAIAVLALAPIAHADDDPLNDPGVQKTLRAMANASTWFHPDLFGMTVGMRRYAHKDYAGALKYFEIGSYYADKLSQLSTGLMYMNGEGVKKDPVTAYAWIDLAAERDYPDFVATRDQLKAELTPEQLAQAMQVRGKLAGRYADAVAKPRLAVQLRQGQMQLTGSRTGFNSGVSHLNTKDNCGPALVVGGRTVAQAGCGNDDMYAKDNWDPDLYFAKRDREWKATVTVGAVEEQGKSIDQLAQPNATTAAEADKPTQKQR
ncbi:MAG: sel1 repeat family protein [Proteobacteria bacterium]|nr:sel1 repeat family protein [Pseudomonadota bacterium]